jgi:hypothetical protein
MQREQPTFQEVISLITPIRVKGKRQYLVAGRAGYYTKPKYAQKAARDVLSKRAK